MIVVLLAHCIVSGVRAEKIRESIVQSLMEQPTQFSATPFSAQGTRRSCWRGRRLFVVLVFVQGGAM